MYKNGAENSCVSTANWITKYRYFYSVRCHVHMGNEKPMSTGEICL